MGNAKTQQVIEGWGAYSTLISSVAAAVVGHNSLYPL